VTGSLPVESTVLEEAKKKNCIVISTPHDTFTASRLVTPSIPVEDVMTRDVKYFYADDPIREIKDDIVLYSHRAYPVVDNNGKLVGVISYGDLLNVTSHKVILVDHNEKSQAVEGIEEAEVIEIIDHHRVGDIQTLSPIYMRNEPVGSTGTVVTKIFKEYGVEIERKIAGLLLSAILSDTILLKSPTTTKDDHEVVEFLAEKSGLDPEKWGLELIRNRTYEEASQPEEALKKDLKRYRMGKRNVGVAQVEVLNSDQFKNKKEKLIEVIQNYEKTGDFDLLVLMVTDIIKEETLLIFNPEHSKAIGRAFEKPAANGELFLEGVMSRKKQVIPVLNRYFGQN